APCTRSQEDSNRGWRSQPTAGVEYRNRWLRTRALRPSRCVRGVEHVSGNRRSAVERSRTRSAAARRYRTRAYPGGARLGRHEDEHSDRRLSVFPKAPDARQTSHLQPDLVRPDGPVARSRPRATVTTGLPPGRKIRFLMCDRAGRSPVVTTTIAAARASIR